jgi:hypothetical protein
MVQAYNLSHKSGTICCPDAVQSIHIFIIYVSENHCESMYLLQPVIPSGLSSWIWKYRTLYTILISLIQSFSNVIFNYLIIFNKFLDTYLKIFNMCIKQQKKKPSHAEL